MFFCECGGYKVKRGFDIFFLIALCISQNGSIKRLFASDSTSKRHTMQPDDYSVSQSALNASKHTYSYSVIHVILSPSPSDSALSYLA